MNSAEEKNAMNTKTSTKTETKTETKTPVAKPVKEPTVKVEKPATADRPTMDLKVGTTYLVVRNREEVEGVSPQRAIEEPADVVQAKLVAVHEGEFAFDDGRFTSTMVLLCVGADDAHDYVYPDTKEGRAKATKVVSEIKESVRPVLEAAKVKDTDAFMSAVSGFNLADLVRVAILLGGKERDLRKVGRARPRKLAALKELHLLYWSKA